MSSMTTSEADALGGAPSPTSVYRYYDRNGVLIYVGITKQGMGRNLQHNGYAEWWQFVARQEIEHLPDRASALALEKALIQEHRPPFNRQHNPGHEDMRGVYLLLMSTPEAGAAARELFEGLPRGARKRGPRWLALNGPHRYGDGAVFLTLPEHEALAPVLTMPIKGVPVFEQKTGFPTAQVTSMGRRGPITALRTAEPGQMSLEGNARCLLRWQGVGGTPQILRVFIDNAEGPVVG
jgi:hypothetical protein